MSFKKGDLIKTQDIPTNFHIELEEDRDLLTGYYETVLDFYDNSSGLPSNPSEGDKYIAEATANGWTIDHIYFWDGTDWQDWGEASGNHYYYCSVPDKYYYHKEGDAGLWYEVGEGHRHVLDIDANDVEINYLHREGSPSYRILFPLSNTSSTYNPISDSTFAAGWEGNNTTGAWIARNFGDTSYSTIATDSQTKVNQFFIPFPFYRLQPIIKRQTSITTEIAYNAEVIYKLGVEFFFLIQTSSTDILDNTLLGNLYLKFHLPQEQSTLPTKYEPGFPTSDPFYTATIPIYYYKIAEEDCAQKSLFVVKYILSPTVWDLSKIPDVLLDPHEDFLASHSIYVEVYEENRKWETIGWGPISTTAYLRSDYIQKSITYDKVETTT